MLTKHLTYLSAPLMQIEETDGLDSTKQLNREGEDEKLSVDFEGSTCAMNRWCGPDCDEVWARFGDSHRAASCKVTL